MSKFLDKDGLAHLWERIQELVATCGSGSIEQEYKVLLQADGSMNTIDQENLRFVFGSYEELLEKMQNYEPITGDLVIAYPYGDVEVYYMYRLVDVHHDSEGIKMIFSRALTTHPSAGLTTTAESYAITATANGFTSIALNGDVYTN